MHNPSSGSSNSSGSASSIFGKPQSSPQERTVISADDLKEGEQSESRALSEFRRQYLKLFNDWKASNSRYLERYRDIKKDARLALDDGEWKQLEKDRKSIVDDLKALEGLHSIDEEGSGGGDDDPAIKRRSSPDIVDESMKKRRSYVW